MRYAKNTMLALSVLLLTSCGIIDLAYNNAASFVASEFDDAFDLNPAQSDQLDSRLQQFFSWHRRQELASYRQMLDQAALAAADGISAGEFLALNQDIRLAWQRSLEKAIDSLGDLAVTLTPTQIEQYQAYHRESSEDFEDYLQMSQQQREIYRVKRNFERLENWFGDFDYYLAQKVSARLESLPELYEPWLRYREARHQALIAALQNAPGGITPQRLREILMDPSTDYARAFEPARVAFWQAYAEALEDISSWVTEAHRQHLVARLQKYARVVARLSADS